jgi:general secretion pathway protein D
VVQFQYYDVGVNVDVTPHILLNRQIAMTVNVAVQALAGEQNVGGLNLPIITNRSVVHDIRLDEGETSVLGGIISDSESKGMSGIPGLLNIPILKYLFAQQNNSRTKSEVIIMLTPHIIRMPNVTMANLRGFEIGTESVTKLKELAPIRPEAPATPSAASNRTTPAPAPSTPPQPGAVISSPAATANVAPAAPPVPPLPTRQTSAILSFDPPVIAAEPGAAKPFNINISGSDLEGADLTLSFDPNAITIQSARDGGLLSRDGQILAVVQNIDTTAGIAKISLERPPGAPVISGNGALVTLMISAGPRKGDSTLKVTNFAVRDLQQNVAIGKPAEARVTVH